MGDDAFGAFTFAINGSNTSTSPQADGDDEDWGDFVESPIRSNLPDTNNKSSSVWIKPTGALPLSLFGQDIVNEESGNGSDLNRNKLDFDGSSSDLNVYEKSGDFKGSEKGNLSGSSSNFNKELGLNFNKEIMVVNEQSVNGSDLNRNKLGFDGFSSDLNVYEKSRDFKGVDKGNLTGSSSNFNLNGKKLNLGQDNNHKVDQLSSDLNFYGKSGDFKGVEKGNLSGSSSNFDLNGRKLNLGQDNNHKVDQLSSELYNYGKSGDFKGVEKGNLSGSSSNFDSNELDLNGKKLNLGKDSNYKVDQLSSDLHINVKSGDFKGFEKGNSNGLSSNFGLIAGNNVVRDPEVKGSSGLSSNFGLIAGNNVVRDPEVKGSSGLSSKTAENGSDLNVNKLNFDPLSLDLNFYGKSGDFKGVDKGNLSGLGSNFDFIAGNNVVRDLEVKGLSGLSLKSDLFAMNNGDQSSQDKDLSKLSSKIGMFPVNNGVQIPQVQGLSGLSFAPDPTALKHSDFSDRLKERIVSNSNLNANFNAKYGHSQVGVVNELNLGMDSFMGNNGNNLHSILNHSSVNEEIDDDDDDDDGWEFKDAYSELKVDEGDNNKVTSKQQEAFGTPGLPSQADNGSQKSIDFSKAPSDSSVKPVETDFSFGVGSAVVPQNGFSSDSFFNSEQSGFLGGLNSDQSDSEEWFGNFQGAVTGNGLEDVPKGGGKASGSEVEVPSHNGKAQDVPKGGGKASGSEVEVPSHNGKAQENETKTNTHKGALPLALFGDEELEINDSSNAQGDFTHMPSFTRTGGNNNEGSNYSIHDVISNLYSKAQENTSVKNLEKLTGNSVDLNHSDVALSHIPENFDEDFDDDSWEFKDAPARAPTLQLNNHLDFYTRLKDELYFICRCHLDNLKKARDSAALSGENVKVLGIEEEIQEASKELQEENINSEIPLDSQKNREGSLDEFLDVLQEPNFQVLESKYQLSRKLNLAQKDLKSAIEAAKFTKLKLSILSIGSVEDQSNYVSTWCKILSVCAQELKHGALIWRQLIEKNLQSCTVSEPRVKDFVISLAEIYRVVTILGASTKLYAPWILSNSINSTGLYSVLEDCFTVWSSLRIEEILEALPVEDECQSRAKALLASIKCIDDLDELKLRDLVFNQQDSTCRLSLLSSKVIPEMKLITWDGKTYFVSLANLWANLVSCDCPELPNLLVAS